MNIEHDGKTYEVLTIDRISEARFAATATGKVVPITTVTRDGHPYHGIIVDGQAIVHDAWKSLGIQPLRLVPKEPFKIRAAVSAFDISGWVTLKIDGVSPGLERGMKFDLVLVSKDEA